MNRTEYHMPQAGTHESLEHMSWNCYIMVSFPTWGIWSSFLFSLCTCSIFLACKHVRFDLSNAEYTVYTHMSLKCFEILHSDILVTITGRNSVTVWEPRVCYVTKVKWHHVLLLLLIVYLYRGTTWQCLLCLQADILHQHHAYDIVVMYHSYSSKSKRHVFDYYTTPNAARMFMGEGKRNATKFGDVVLRSYKKFMEGRFSM